MSTANPVMLALARAVTKKELPLSTVSVIAPLITGAPIMRISWAHYNKSMDDCSAPDGVTVKTLDKEADTIVALPPMICAERMIIATAWTYGAWDVVRHTMPAQYEGRLPPYIDDHMRNQGYCEWSFRPMLGGPDIRAKQSKPDITIDSLTLSRDGLPPDVRLAPITPLHSQVIRLGQSDQPASSYTQKYKKCRPATIGQIRFLRFLHAVNYLKMPSGLNFDQASDLIDALKSKNNGAIT